MSTSDKRVLALLPRSDGNIRTAQLISRAVELVDANLVRIDHASPLGSLTEQVYALLESVDLIVADITGSDPSVMYRVGFAHALNRPVLLLVGQPEHTPFDLRSVPAFFYQAEPYRTEEASGVLANMISRALLRPSMLAARPTTAKDIYRVFVSYSHVDREYVARLRTHIRPLEMRGLVDLWDDSRIARGAEWKAEIEAALQRARAAVLVISADFLASDFIVNNELPPLIAKAESQGTRIISIIARPCRFQREPTLSRFQAMNNPAVPLALQSDAERELVFDATAKVIEELLVQ